MRWLRILQHCYLQHLFKSPAETGHLVLQTLVALDPLVNFLTVNRSVGWYGNPDLGLLAILGEDSDLDVVTNAKCLTQVNELLVQMEEHLGILIACTNLREGLDSTAARRFDAKVGFDYLSPDTAWAFFQKVLRYHKVRLGGQQRALGRLLEAITFDARGFQDRSA